MTISKSISEQFGIRQEFVDNIIALIDEGSTIPFIARYRKESHGSCDDQVLREISDRLSYLRNLEKRKKEVTASISEQQKLTEEIAQAIEAAGTLTEVEDIYRPFKQKRKTRASVAISRGLSPLADILEKQGLSHDPLELASSYVSEENGVPTQQAAIQGASDIIAERISDDAEIRKVLRALIWEKGKLTATLDKSCADYLTYETYDDFKQSLKAIPGYRVLAINRGEKAKALKVKLEFDPEIAYSEIAKQYKKSNRYTDSIIDNIIRDSYTRLLFPSLENEARGKLTEMASEQAIKMFELNLKPLLLQAPLKDKVILGLDPAYRTGCKIAVIDKNGDVLDHTVVYPTPPQSKKEESIARLKPLILKHKVDVIAIGNGTATREAELFVGELIHSIPERSVAYSVVNEAGASVYSASKLGALEFPDYDVSIRSAISIARRLQDPLAELIKIDVKSIGVGQYQHDMPEARLDSVLGGVVEACVNSVGVDLNTASLSLLSYVSGLNKTVAANILDYRKRIKFFTNRKQLLEVPKLGAKAFEQCAGFLRIQNGNEILDNTSVHPESYKSVRKLLATFKLTEKDIANGNVNHLPQLIRNEGSQRVADLIGVGVPTLNDIVSELLKPGRDIRQSMAKPTLRSDVLSIADLSEGMIMDGTVRNVMDFGVFVDIGVHQDGLVHISQLSEGYVSHPSEVVTVGDNVMVKVLSVDITKKRISLTMRF